MISGLTCFLFYIFTRKKVNIIKIIVLYSQQKKGINPFFNLSPDAADIVPIGLRVPVAVAIVEILVPTQLCGSLRGRPIVA